MDTAQVRFENNQMMILDESLPLKGVKSVRVLKDETMGIRVEVKTLLKTTVWGGHNAEELLASVVLAPIPSTQKHFEGREAQTLQELLGERRNAFEIKAYLLNEHFTVSNFEELAIYETPLGVRFTRYGDQLYCYIPDSSYLKPVDASEDFSDAYLIKALDAGNQLIRVRPASAFLHELSAENLWIEIDPTHAGVTVPGEGSVIFDKNGNALKPSMSGGELKGFEYTLGGRKVLLRYDPNTATISVL